ncbi:MAG: hypothetical protein H0T79_17285, partial [Deltaproteobacteria bacterium]|nr:hypothetical protein [Deltaproteobacteria bacterium]
MARILILFNQTEDDVVELWRQDGRTAPDWDPTKLVEGWDTVSEEMALLEASIRAGGHEPISVNIRDDLGTLMDVIAKTRPDAIMNLVEFFHDDIEHEHHVPALFELLDIQYTGNRPMALSLCQKKPHTKALLVAAGVPTPRSFVVEQMSEIPTTIALRFPLMVKPAFEDASGGIDAGSVVHTRAELETRILRVLTEDKMVALVEEYIEGRELHCAIIGNDPPEPLPLYEMEFAGGVDDDGRALPRIITYRAKWDPYSREHHAVSGKCPVDDLEPEIVAHVQDVAIRAFRTLGCRDYARVDMRLDPITGEAYVLEVNPNPDLADGCAFAASVRASGRTYEQTICELVELALARGRAKPARSEGPSDT